LARCNGSNNRLALIHIRSRSEYNQAAAYEALALLPQDLFLCTECAERDPEGDALGGARDAADVDL
jgi:hypothetical protein